MTSRESGPSALVLGAGFQGVCAALALASRGYAVELVDQADRCFTRASGRNEAKIHLGFVYANDDSFRTASLMLDASLAFAPSLESWLGRELDWPAMCSTPFTYAVMPDSLLSLDQVCAFYARVQAAYEERLAGRTYLGKAPTTVWRPIARRDWPAWIASDQISGLIETAEVAIDLERLRAQLEAALVASPRIALRFGSRVDAVERIAGGFRVSGSARAGERWQREAGIVVNCLWEGRLQLDRSMGIEPSRQWVYRLKYRVLGGLPPELVNLPSLTFVLGPYGDIATYAGASTYLSWYPTCLQGWSDELTPPKAWAAACEGRADPATGAAIARETLAALDRIVPGVAGSTVTHVDAGVICSWGHSYVDVDDPRSELHERHAIGVAAHEGYFSIDTGKFTCAPLFASRLLDALDA